LLLDGYFKGIVEMTNKKVTAIFGNFNGPIVLAKYLIIHDFGQRII
jgi:hypothetical protein